jgi:hypothetical protein
MKSEDVTVELRLIEKTGSKMRASADVVLSFGGDGVIRVSDFSVVHGEGEAPRVMVPARKGGNRYYPTVMLMGKIRAMVEDPILSEYERARSKRDGAANAR